MTNPIHMVIVNIFLCLVVGCGLVIYYFIYPKKTVKPLYLLLILCFLPLASIARNGIYESGDFAIHTKFAMQFFENLQQGILIPRWVSDHCLGYGCPVFMFLYTLPYYVVSLFHLTGFSFINSMKLFLITSFVFSGVGMYLWIKSEIDEKAGLVAAIFYLYSPYHLIDLHFRASVGELLSITLLPFVFLLTKKLIETRNTIFFIFNALTFSFLILSHQVTSLVSLPLIVLYGIYLIYQQRKRKIRNAILFILSIISGIGLAAFYWLPVLFEGKYIHFSQSNSFEFNKFSNFFYSPGRLGLLLQGRHGELYFTVGYVQWIILIIAFYLLWKRKIAKKYLSLFIGTLLVSAALLLFMQEFTLPLWRILPVLKNFIFTWRLFIEFILCFSIIAAIVCKTINRNIFTIFICFFAIVTTILNWGNRGMIPSVDDTKLRKEEIFSQGPGTYEITTPIWVDESKKWVGETPKKNIEVLGGNARIVELKQRIIEHEYAISADNNIKVKENTFFFPGWKLYDNGHEIPIQYRSENFPGVIQFDLDKGLHYVVVTLTDTSDRFVGKLISLLAGSILLLLLIAKFAKSNNLFSKKKRGL